MEGAQNRHLLPDVVPVFQEGIGLVLSRWSALQLAVDNEWGGRDSRRKSELLCSDILSWFTQTREPLYIDDLESILEEAMFSLNTEVDDGSIEEVAEKLIIMHEECLEGDLRFIEKLKQTHPPRVAQSHVSQVMSDNDDSSDDEEDNENRADASRNNGPSDMIVDAAENNTNSSSQPLSVNQPKRNITAEAGAEDGWVQVSSRRSRGKRN